MMRDRFAGRSTAVAAFFLAAPLALAGPTLTEVVPPGGQRGSAVRLEMYGTGLGGKIEVRSGIPGSLTELSAGGPARQFLLEIAEDAVPGAYPLAVATGDGLTNTWMFSVSGFPETREAEAASRRPGRNDTAGSEERIAVPAVVNGTLVEADRDLYRVALEAGEHIVFEVEARRLGSAIDPVLSVRSPQGRTLGRSDDAPGIGGDARLAIEAAVSGDYVVEVHDARFSKQGKNFYRLVAGPLEYAEAIYPLGWTEGRSVDVQLSGGSLAAPRTVTVEGGHVSLGSLRGGLPLPFLRGSGPEVLEPKGRRRRDLVPGTVVNGLIGQPGEVDSYRLRVRPGEQWMVETQAAILGTSSLYTLLVMRDRNGSKLASAGDQPPEELLSNISTRAETFGDPALGFRVPEGVRELHFSVEDLLGRGGPGYGYRLVARRQPADFIARLDDTVLNIPRGGSASFGVTLDRRGYDGAVRIVVDELPEGVLAEGGNIPAEFGGMTTDRRSLSGRVILTATDDASTGPLTLRLRAEAVSGDGVEFERPVLTSSVLTPVAGTQQRPVRLPGAAGLLEGMIVAGAPASIELLIPRSLRLIQGQKHDIRWAYHARPGVQALTPVVLSNAPSVANLRVLGDAKIKAGDPESVLEMNTTMGTPAMRMDLVLQADVRADGVRHTIESPAILVEIVQGYSVGAPDGPVTVAPGETFEIAGSFAREPEFDSAVTVEGVNLPVGVKCDSSTLGQAADGYALRCDASPQVEVGEYLVEIAPRSVLAGRDKEAVPYNIPPVEAVLVVTGTNTVAAAQPH